MNDFRVKAVIKAANALGWTCESYDESKSMLSIRANGNWTVSFANKKEVAINVPVMVLPDSLVFSGVASTLLRMTNTHFNYAKFDLLSNYVIACSAISTSLFMRDDYEHELKDCLKDINQEMITGTKALQSVLEKYID